MYKKLRGKICSKPQGPAPGRCTSSREMAAEGRAKDRPTATSKGRTGRKVSLDARAG